MVVDGALDVIEKALTDAVVVASGLRLRPETDEQIALNIVAALEDAGFTIIAMDSTGGDPR